MPTQTQTSQTTPFPSGAPLSPRTPVPTDPSFWDRIAEEYAIKPVEDPETFTKKVQHTIGLMEPGSRILDVGSATGSLSLRLGAHAREIHGVDLSPEMVRIARHKVREAGQEHLHFHVGTLDSELPFEPASFDGITAFSLLHLVPDRARTLESIYALLKPGGFFVSSTVALGETWVPYRPLLKVMKWLGKAPDVYVVRKQDVLQDLQAAGFETFVQPIPELKETTLFVSCRKPL
jgi:arsenite methyltransferase